MVHTFTKSILHRAEGSSFEKTVANFATVIFLFYAFVT